MHRNRGCRVDVLVKLPGEADVRQVTELLYLAFEPTTSAWELQADGEWRLSAKPGPDAPPLVDLQESLIAAHHRRHR